MQSVFERPNPFTQDMRVLRCPDNMTTISIAGFQIEPDADHHIVVPLNLVSQLTPHGCRELTGPELEALRAGAKRK